MFNTMKRKMFFRLTAVCLIAVSALIACTKDYGSDIKELQDRVDNLSQQVADLDALIKAGSVITAVTPVANGTKVTLSDGKEFTIYNGEKGDPGKDGTVWKIGDNGNWWSDNGDGFKDSGKPSQGPKGDNGKSAYEVAKANGFTGTEAEWLASLKGADGKSAYEVAKANGFTGTEKEWLASLKGEKGDKGEPGDYFVPCTDKSSEDYGHWIKVNGSDPTKRQTLEEMWLPVGTITAVWDDDAQVITFHNVEDADEGVVEISLATKLASLAVIPEVWDATLGMPQATVYAILPSPMELERIWNGKAGNMPRLRDWSMMPDAAQRVLSPAGWECFFWCALYSSYLGVTNQTNLPGYSAAWDVNGSSFNYYWNDINNGGGSEYELVYSTLKAAVKDALADMTTRLDNVSKEGTWLTRQPPVSKLDIKYRVNPASAALGDYQFNMIDRTLEVRTKADGDKRSHAVTKLNVEKKGADQLNATGYIDFFHYWANQPTEWLIQLYNIKVAQAWFYWGVWDGAGTGVPTKWRGERDLDLAKRYLSILDYAGNINAAEAAMQNWMNLNGVGYKTIVALEASKNGKGAEAIVSDYTEVKMEYVYPIWTCYDHHYNDGYEGITSRWRLTQNWISFQNGGLAHENDYLVEGQTYDVAKHMRFADAYYGRLEDLGFEVEYKYHVFSAANGETSITGAYESWADDTLGTSGETETNFGGWDKVDVTTDGKVSVKTDDEGNTVEGAIGKYVIITADARIKNVAKGTYYTSSVHSNATYWNTGVMYDEFAGHYILLIVPDTNKTLNVTYDLGDVDYLALSKSFKTLAPLKSLDPRPQEGRNHEWDDALDMDMEGFNNVYTTDPVMTATPARPESYSATFARANEMFTVTLNNKVPLGPGFVTYTFTPKDSKYSKVCYTIKWNVVIDWSLTEPVLNPDYILYDDDARTQLTATIINPDPNDQYGNVRPDKKFPYVDSIVAVKGKKVGDTWKPQSSIKEHIKDYGQYLDIQKNVSNLSMAINWNNTRDSQGNPLPTTSAKIEKVSDSTPTYKYQEIIMLEAFKAYEEYRDYVVDITITLANGTSQVVKAYIVRFINPFKLKVTDVILHTHKQDWCAKPANIMILDVDDESIVIYDFATNKVNAQYQTIYPGIFEALQDPANRPTWKLVTPVDPSFGEILENGYETENLRVDTTSGWFYWQNLGTNLQTDKYTQYEVTLTLPGLAALADTGKVTVLSVEHSHVFHSECDADAPTPQPGDHVRNGWEIIFE